MRMHLFASSLLAATSSAMHISKDLAAATTNSENTKTAFFLAQTQEATSWNIDGTVDSKYMEPDDDCCIIYTDVNFTSRMAKPVCNSPKEGRDQILQQHFFGKQFATSPKGVDCGKNAWARLFNYHTKSDSYDDQLQFVGRMTYSWSDEMKQQTSIRVGKYDDKVQPAVMLFETGDCKGVASFHLYDRSMRSPGAYGLDDIKYQRNDAKVQSVMLRSGYSVSLFAKNGWQGATERIKGAYADDNGEGKLKCLPVTKGTLFKGGVKSLKIRPAKAGRATGYWKGITTTEAVRFSYTVGITSTDAATYSQANANKLEKSLKSGWSHSVSGEVGASIGFASGNVGGNGGWHGSSVESNALESNVSHEISSTATHGTTSVHETTCTPKDGETRAGVWQWVITSEDLSVSAFTPHTVCRTGDLANVSPECGFWDCDNADCSKCKEPIKPWYMTKKQVEDETEKLQDQNDE